LKKKLQVENFRGSSIAQRLLTSGLSVNSLRTNALLRKDEWIELDRSIVDVARDRLVGIADLQSRGLVQTLGGLGTLVSQYEAASDMTEAEISMDGVKPGEEDDQEFNLRSVPVPIVHKDFRINIRRLEASRKLGDGLDTTQGQVAARRVADRLERILFNGAGITIDGNVIYGYCNHPKRNIGTATGPWSVVTNIYNTVIQMVQDAQDTHMYGPYILYISGDQWMSTLGRYTDGSGQIALNLLKQIPQIQDVKPADQMPANSACLVQMTKDVVDLAVAQDIVTVEWDSQGGMVTHFKVMAVMVPRIKYDYDGRCGIVHYTGLDGTGSGS
jgi:uncharacterized linocin/CFP29 family protein